MTSDECVGPLVWYDVVGGEPERGGVRDDDSYASSALLACTSCDYVSATGNFFDARHRNPELIHEGL